MLCNVPLQKPIIPGSVVSIDGRPIGICVQYSEFRKSGRVSIDMKVHLVTAIKIGRTNAIFGNPLTRPQYRGSILGRIKIKYRQDDYAKVYIKDPYRTRCFLLVWDGPYVTHGEELDCNEKINLNEHSTN